MVLMVNDRSSAYAAGSRDTHFMRRALELAEIGRWSAPPNPAVGAVVVAGDSIVGEGFHLRPGTPHAEIVALDKAGDQARGASLYVNLEPCNHHGRTPPCTLSIIEAGISRVIVPCMDPSPAVSGRGLNRLRDAGIKVVEDVECQAARRLNERHFRAAEEGRPVVIARVARTLDGRIALHGPETLAVTGESARQFVGLRRSEVDAIMVGIGTLLTDDPRLNARAVDGSLLSRQPVRVIADASLDTPCDAAILSEPGGGVLLLATEDGPDDSRRKKLEEAGARVIRLPADAEGRFEALTLLRVLAAEGINSLLVEGGGKLLSSLAAKELIDFWQIWIGPKIIGAGRGVLFEALETPIHLGSIHTIEVGDDLLVSAFPE